ncbi:hypothetical protein GCM10010174_61590 [Kutzneria viridogrisea]|uniref:6-carboxytetrahydropterin synthase n=1 Tax=Kutzneria viridogrisea TaxID=47990 RepID=UPI0015FF5D77
MSHCISVAHSFETAHRLPHLPGKCESLHGHSWWAEVTVTAPRLAAGMVVEFGPFKSALRRWIDDHLDHGVMLGPDDPLVGVLRQHGTKLYEVTGWPTVENVAAMLAEVAAEQLADIVRAPGSFVSSVVVRETAVNRAAWTAP